MADENKRATLDVDIVRTIERYKLFRLLAYFGGGALLLFMGIVAPLMITAGTETVISIFYNAVLDFKLEAILPYAIAAGFAELWRRERKNRKISIKREHDRLALLEKRIDPNRTSSDLEE